MLNRRDALKSLFALGGAALVPATLEAQNALMEKGMFTLPPLPYPADALEPHIDAQTMTIHHDRHHKTYVDNLNAAVAKHEQLKGMTIEQIVRDVKSVPADVQTAVRNNGGGHLNHTMFWSMMRKGGGMPAGELKTAMDRAFGSQEKFKEQFNDAATKRFGSGWAWLVMGPDRSLKIVSTPNQDNPLMDGMGTPLLGVDVWEHAYYLKYQNKRADYLNAFHNVINWDYVSERYARKA